MGMREVLERRIDAWLADPESSVEYAEELDGRWAVRMRQEARDATTVWFTIGQRSIEYEAYVLPAAEGGSELFEQALHRNMRAWRAHFALDQEGELLLRGRLAQSHLTDLELDLALGEIYDAIEVAFRPLLRSLLAGRENSG
jgi:hypothetical protein